MSIRASAAIMAGGEIAPLATLHKWQGLSDVFLGHTGGSTAYGLNDLYRKIGYIIPSYDTITGFYHDFSAKEKTAGFTDAAGSEFDVLYAYNFKRLGLLG